MLANLGGCSLAEASELIDTNDPVPASQGGEEARRKTAQPII